MALCCLSEVVRYEVGVGCNGTHLGHFSSILLFLGRVTSQCIIMYQKVLICFNFKSVLWTSQHPVLIQLDLIWHRMRRIESLTPRAPEITGTLPRAVGGAGVIVEIIFISCNRVI